MSHRLIVRNGGSASTSTVLTEIPKRWTAAHGRAAELSDSVIEDDRGYATDH